MKGEREWGQISTCPSVSQTGLANPPEMDPFFMSPRSASALVVPPSPAPPHSYSPNITAEPPPPPSLPLCLTADEVKVELKKLNTGKAAGPDKVCPRLLKICADQLAKPLQELFNLSLQSRRVPVLWKTSCLVPLPKTGCPAMLNDYRPVALTSHIMKTLDRLFLRHMRPLTEHALNPLSPVTSRNIQTTWL